MGTVVWEGAIEEAGYEVGLLKWVRFEEGHEQGKRTRHAVKMIRPGQAEQSSCEAKLQPRFKR